VSEGPSGPAFPDGPKLELDQLLAQLIGRAQDVIAAQGRLRGLLRANQSFVGSLTLPVLLDRIVRAACELTQARYGAIGVIDPAGGGLEELSTSASTARPQPGSDDCPKARDCSAR
jgi:hypothetical protein